MTSTRISKLARAIQKANPGMKYTEALRQAKAETNAATPRDTPGRKAIKNYAATGHVDPVGEFDPAEYSSVVRSGQIVDLGAGWAGTLDPFNVGADGEKVVLDEVHDMRTSRKQSGKMLDALIRQARSSTENTQHTGELRPLVHHPSDIKENFGVDEYLENFAPRPSEADSSSASATNLVKLGNMLIVAPPGAGAMVAIRGLAEASEAAGAELEVVAASNADDPGSWPESAVIHKDSESPGEVLASRSGRRFIAIESPEAFADPGAWWKALTPLLEDPAVVVSVRVHSVAAVPAGTVSAFQVRAVMGKSVHSEDDVRGTVEAIPDEVRQWSELGSPGTGIIREGNAQPTGFYIDPDAARYVLRQRR